MSPTEETIRTRVLQSARINWKAYLVGALGVASTIIGTSVGYGARMERNSGIEQKVTAIAADMDAIRSDVSAIRSDVSAVKATQNDQGEWMGRLQRNWDDAGDEAGKGYQPRTHRVTSGRQR